MNYCDSAPPAAMGTDDRVHRAAPHSWTSMNHLSKHGGVGGGRETKLGHLSLLRHNCLPAVLRQHDPLGGQARASPSLAPRLKLCSISGLYPTRVSP